MSSSPKDVISQIRSKWASVPPDAQEDFHNALVQLSQDLYSRDSHFVLELIQNADDNVYEEGTKPKIAFKITPRGILVLNNEKGFEEPQVRSLCSIGRSTKSKARGYIGEKGIGFKSVFKITDEPHIFSKGYRFKFSVKDSADRIGFVVPHWIEKQPPYALATLTTLHLPLRTGSEAVLSYFDQLRPHLLLFLNKLEVIEVDNSLSGERRLVERTTLSGEHVVLNTIVWSKDGIARQTTLYFLMCRCDVEKPRGIDEPKRVGVNSSTIILAFPLGEDGSPIASTDHEVFAYLPVRQFGFRFIIQADFLVPANREDILRDKQWNTWLRDALSASVCHSVAKFKESAASKHTFYRFLPRSGEISDDFFEPFVEALYADLRNLRCVESESGKWELPSKILLAGPEVRRLVTNDELRGMIDLEFAHSGIDGRDIPPALRCGRFALSHLFLCLQKSEWFARKSADWFSLLFAYLVEHATTDDSLSRIRNLRIFPLANGKLGSLAEGPIFIPEESPARYEFESDIRLLRRDLLAERKENLEMLKNLIKLGLHSFSAAAVIDSHILPLYSTDAWTTKTNEVRGSHLAFIKDHFGTYLQERSKDQQYAMDGLRKTLLIRSTSAAPGGKTVYGHAPDMYLPIAYSTPYDLEKLFEGIQGVLFVSPMYLASKRDKKETLEDRRGWAAFFTRIGVNTVPRVVSVQRTESAGRRNRTYTEYEFAPETRTLASDLPRVEQFLAIADSSWGTAYGNKATRSTWGAVDVESRLISEFRDVQVPTLSGARYALGECILDSAAVRNVFGTDAPILTVRLTCKEMITALGIADKPTAAFAIAQLRKMKESCTTDFTKATKYYKHLHRYFDETPDEIQQAFEGDRLILAGAGATAKFHSIAEVCWRDLGPATASVKTPLRSHYQELQDFFINIGVAEYLGIRDLAELLKLLAEKESPSDEELDTVFNIYHDLNRYISRVENAGKDDWLRELLDSNVLWTNKGEFWKNDGDVFLNDHSELFQLFAACPTIAFFNVRNEDVPTLSSLAGYAGIRPVSVAVSVNFLNADQATKSREWTCFVRSLVVPIARYLRSKMSKLYSNARDNRLFHNLAQVECLFVNQLNVRYNLNSEVRASTREFALQGSNLYISSACQEPSDAIAQQLGAYLGGGDELVNFVAVLCTRRDFDAFLESRHIPDFSAEEREYFEQLNRSGIDEPTLVPRGLLAGANTVEIVSNPRSESEGGPSTVETLDEGPTKERDSVSHGPGDISSSRTWQGVSLSDESSELPGSIEPVGASVEKDSSSPNLPGWVPEIAPNRAENTIAEVFQPNKEFARNTSLSSFSSLSIRFGATPGVRTSGTKTRGAFADDAYAIGIWGEEWVVWTHLRQRYLDLYGASSLFEHEAGFTVGTSDKKIDVVWTNSEEDQHLPFDVLIREDGVERFIEVKSSSTDSLEWFDVSGHQWKLAIEAGSRFSIYRVYRAGTRQPRLKIIENPVALWSLHQLEADPIRLRL